MCLECRITDWIDTEACNRSYVHAHMFQEILHNTCCFSQLPDRDRHVDAAQALFRLAAVWSPRRRRAIYPLRTRGLGSTNSLEGLCRFCSQGGRSPRQACGADSSVATPLHVSVTETELRDIAKTKECSLPGVSFDPTGRRWHVQWYDEKLRHAYFSIARAREAGDDGVWPRHSPHCRAAIADAKRGPSPADPCRQSSSLTTRTCEPCGCEESARSQASTTTRHRTGGWRSGASKEEEASDGTSP